MCVLVTVIIGLSVSLSVRYNDNGDRDNLFAPGDTRIIGYSSSFCEGLTLSGDNSATLYLLNATPPLSGPTHKLEVRAPHLIRFDSYEYLFYYLHSGSKMSMTYCIEDGSAGKSLSFFLIKGSSNFDSWKDDGNSIHAIKYFTISNTCPSTLPPLTFTASSEDSYYFAFDNINSPDVTLQGTLTFNRTEYLPDKVRIHNSCEIQGNSCTLPIPYNSGYIAMVRIGESNVEPDANVSYNWSCSARVWLYVIIVVIPILFIVVVSLTLCVLCIYCARKRSKAYSSLPTETARDESPATVTSDTTTTSTTAVPPPPPTNPDYPPSYGSTRFIESQGEPPPYKADGSNK